MSYEILSDDIKSSSAKSYSDKKKKGKKPKFNPMYIHIAIIALIIILLGIYLLSNIEFEFKDSKKPQELITIIGTLQHFNETYNDTIEIYSSQFTLETKNSKFDVRSEDIEIEDFNGLISLQNKSIIFQGTANKIEYGSNELNLNGEKFILNSTKKTKIDLQFNNLKLDFKNGRIKLDSELNYEFGNSTIILRNSNFSMNYDGTFSFTGHTDNLTLITYEPKLEITYRK